MQFMRLFTRFFIAVFVFVTAQNNLFADGGFMGFFGGYNGAFGSYSGINNAIDYYNNQPWRANNKKLANIKYMDGACFGVNVAFNALYLEAQWTGRHANIYSEGVNANNGITYRRDIKYRNNTMNFGMGLITPRLGRLRVGLGGAMDFGDSPIMTRIYDINAKEKPDFESIPFSNVTLAFSANSVIIYNFTSFLGLMVKPYYMWNVFEHDHYNLHHEIDPQPTFVSDAEMAKYKNKPNHFGLQASLIFMGEF